MSKLAELRRLTQIAEETGNNKMHDCLVGLMCLAASEIVDGEMYDTILARIRQQMDMTD